jgi:hypothetical protein
MVINPFAKTISTENGVRFTEMIVVVLTETIKATKAEDKIIMFKEPIGNTAITKLKPKTQNRSIEPEIYYGDPNNSYKNSPYYEKEPVMRKLLSLLARGRYFLLRLIALFLAPLSLQLHKIYALSASSILLLNVSSPIPLFSVIITRFYSRYLHDLYDLNYLKFLVLFSGVAEKKTGIIAE